MTFTKNHVLKIIIFPNYRKTKHKFVKLLSKILLYHIYLLDIYQYGHIGNDYSGFPQAVLLLGKYSHKKQVPGTLAQNVDASD